MRISRRTLLVGGAVGGVGLGGGAWVLTLGAPAEGAALLTREELTIVSAVAEAMFPGAPMPLDGLEADVAGRVDRIVADVMEHPQAAAFRYVLRMLEWGTAASRGTRFSELPLADRQEVLRTWREPDVLARRVAADSLKAVLGMAYFSHPRVVRAIGWRTGCGGTST